MCLLRHVLAIIDHLQVTVNGVFFVAGSIFYLIVVFIKLGFMLLVFVLVGINSIYALHAIVCYLSGYCTYLRSCVMLLCGELLNWGP